MAEACDDLNLNIALELIKHEGTTSLVSKDENEKFAIMKLSEEQRIKLITASIADENIEERGIFNHVRSKARNTRKSQFQSENGKTWNIKNNMGYSF